MGMYRAKTHVHTGYGALHVPGTEFHMNDSDADPLVALGAVERLADPELDTTLTEPVKAAETPAESKPSKPPIYKPSK